MADKARSPFGTIVRSERRRRGWTQARLALEVAPHVAATDKRSTFNERSIVAIERKAGSPRDWTCPRSSTVRAIAAAFQFQPGTGAHQDLVEAAAETQQLARTPAQPSNSDSRSTRFIAAGRERYLNRIAEGVAAAAAGKPQALVVRGDAGTGKSWLLLEACRQAVRQYPNLTVLWGTSSTRLGPPEPYQPFRQMLRTMVGGGRSDSPQQPVSEGNRQQIAARIPTALAALNAVGRDLIPRLVPESAFDSETLRERADLQALVTSLSSQPAGQHWSPPGESLHQVLSAYAVDGPLILVLEDLHASDQGTVDALTTILREMSGTSCPLLVLASKRPASATGSPGNGPDFGATRKILVDHYPDHNQDLTGALQREASGSFITALASDLGLTLDPAGVSRVHEQTLGLPVFVAGVLQLLKARAHGFESADALPVLSNANIFDAELDLLPPATSRALIAASVQGETFNLDVLSQVLEIPAGDIRAMMNNTPFWRSGMVQPVGNAGQDAEEFQFVHTLVRDHLYQSCLSEIERAHLHLLTANALIPRQCDGTGALPGQIGHHLERAGEHESAAASWLRAGEMLFAHHEIDSALFAFKRVLAQDVRVSAPVLEAEALLGIGTCMRAMNQHHEAIAWTERGLDFARRRNLPGSEARLLSELGMLIYDAGQVQRGADLLREAIALHELTGDLAEAARSLARLSYNLHRLGDYDEAAHEAQRSIDLSTAINDEALLNGGRIALANCWLDTGRFEEAMELHHLTLDSATAHGDIHRANICLINIALCQIEIGSWNAAARTQEDFLDPGRPVVARFMGTVEFQFGLIAEGRGQYTRARQRFQASLELRQRNGQEAMVIDSLAGLLRMATARWDTGATRQLMREIEQQLERHGWDGIEHVTRVCLAMIGGGQLTGDLATMHRYAAHGLAFLRHRADAMHDERDRERYLRGVPVNQRLFRLATQILDDDRNQRIVSMASD